MTTSQRDRFPWIKKEPDLYSPLVELFKEKFKTQNVEITHGKREHKHGCDLILDINGLCKIGFQIKLHPFTQSTLIEFEAAASHAYDFEVAFDKVTRLSQFIWVTTKGKTLTIWSPEVKEITHRFPFAMGIDLWDGDKLYDQFQTYYPQAFTSIRIDDLNAKADEHSIKRNNVFASHYFYRVFILRLLQKDVAGAQEAVKSAIEEIDRQANKLIYFYRTLKRFYELWQLVIEMKGLKVLIEKYQLLPAYKELSDEYGKTWHECVFLMRLVNDRKVKKYIESRGIEFSVCDYNFLCDFQYIFSQLQILSHEYADSPGGLSSKQICRTLMRFGFPPTEKIAARIVRMKEELKAEKHRSVDSECSLCTGTVLSCLLLANEDKKIIQPVKRWLKKLDHCGYTHENKERYPDADSTKHGLHYAAPVLDAFVDCGDYQSSNRVLKHYFESKAVGKDGFYLRWMRRRNISSLEACAYIFSAFHRYLINGNTDFPFDEAQVKFLRKAIANLVAVLRRETGPNSRPSRLYATRENIQSFCFGLLIGEKRSTRGLLRELMQNFHTRAITIRNHDGLGNPFKRSLMDSNVDRTTRFIEGWISYWETIFYLVDDAPRFGANGAELRKTVKELKDEGYLPNCNPS